MLMALHVVHETEASKDDVKRVPMTTDFCKTARRYVVEKKVPHIESILSGVERGGIVPGTWFGSGHQITLGLIPALIDVLGDRAKFIRLRRNKLDIAYSYAQKNGGPCTSRCIFCLCPLDAAARMPVEGSTWGKLSIFQQYLWFVDELEGQWQTVLRRNPEINYIEVNWDAKLTHTDFARMAAFTGMDKGLEQQAEQVKANEHVHSKAKAAKNYTWMEEQAKEYAQILNVGECSKFTCIDDIHAGTNTAFGARAFI
jgi:hypothetical protein